MVTMDEVIASLKRSGVAVVSSEKLQAKYRNIHTNDVYELIGSYEILDGVRSYPAVYVFSDGTRVGQSTFRRHWEKVND